GLQERRLLQHHVDVVDAAAVLSSRASGNGDQSVERVCLVRHLEQVVALLREPVREEEDDQDRAGSGEPPRRQPSTHPYFTACGAAPKRHALCMGLRRESTTQSMPGWHT